MGFAVPPVPDLLREELDFLLGPADAARWLEGAIAQASVLLDAWGLVPRKVLVGGSQSLCLEARSSDGAEVVLKIPVDPVGGADEAAGLRAWAGDGAPRLLREEPGSAAMLMDHVGRGGGPHRVEALLDLTERLHTADPTGHRFDGLDRNLAHRLRWAHERFADPAYADQRPDLATAEAMLPDLLASDRPVLLHGDLQAKNLIVSGTRLTAFDPIPVLGPAIFDLAFWVAKNPHSGPTMPVLERVGALRPDLDLDLVLRWAWVVAVIENRPYSQATGRTRQEFIDAARADAGC